jgi:prolyl oligopeptidase
MRKDADEVFSFANHLKTHLLSFFLSITSSFLLGQNSTTVPRLSVTDTFWGTPVADPYRWLESEDSDSTKSWLQEQKSLVREEKNRIDNAYMGVYNVVGYNPASFLTWEKRGSSYFRLKYLRGRGPYSSPALCRMDAEEEVIVFDPNLYVGKESIIIEDYEVSNDDKYCALALSRRSSDWLEIRVADMHTNTPLADKLEGTTLNGMKTDSSIPGSKIYPSRHLIRP